MDEAVQAHMKKYDICLCHGQKSLAFFKYPSLHELEECHGVDLGFSYKTCNSAKNFTQYIAQSQRQIFFDSWSTTNFYSLLMDGSTDAGNVDELALI